MARRCEIPAAFSLVQNRNNSYDIMALKIGDKSEVDFPLILR